jgi:predicted small secreted protein
MKVLIVAVASGPRSFNAAMLSTACETLRGGGHEVQVSDLHAMDFDPVARASDFARPSDPGHIRYDIEQRHAVENGGFDHTNSIGTELAINSLRRGARFRQVPVSGTRRQDAPRFDRLLRANLRIFAALANIVRDDARQLLGLSHRRPAES